jgi:signal transduction histidine kinase
MLLTDLDHRSLACNRRFGDLFGVAWHEVVRCDVDDLRRRVMPVIVDPAAWLASLEETYADPRKVLQDDLVLNRDGRVVLRRYSAPVTGPDGEIVGRLWTFRDVTAERRQLEIHRILGQISAFQDPDPKIVCHRIMEAVSEFFDGTTAILSIRRGDTLDFRDVVGPKSVLTRISGNRMRDSYCQYAIREVRPLLIQDAKNEPEYCRVRPARAGFTRYLGAPVLDENGQPIGTICLLDRRSDRVLGDSDIQLMSLVAMRISSELACERHIRERLAEKDAELRRQEDDLVATHGVFEAMNAAFALLGEGPETDELLREQTRLLAGLLGYEAAAVLVRRPVERGFRGYAGSSRPAATALDAFPAAGAIGVITDADFPLLRRLRATHLSYALRREDRLGEVLIALARNGPPPEDARHRIHIEALADQVCLLLESHVLQRELLRTNAELSEMQDELLRSEKLSVAGTLAASTAHDIRNITASLALLASPGSCEPEQALIAVREQLGRFNVLAHRLLSYARPRSIEPRPVDLEGLLDGVLGLTSAQIRVGRVRVERKFGSDLPSAHGDPHQLEHLFINLILNAVQAMDSTGGGTLTVSASKSAETIRIRFSDTGPGISREALDGLFEPFRTTRANGFGLGLFSCRRIAEAHGGTIAASRNPIRGSTFTVTLPIGGSWTPAS